MEHGQMEFLRDGLSNKDCLIPAVTQTFFDLVKTILAASYRNFGGAFFAGRFRSRYGTKILSVCAVTALSAVIIIQTVRLFYHNGLRALESWEGSWY